jgi:hypothetical protein
LKLFTSLAAESERSGPGYRRRQEGGLQRPARGWRRQARTPGRSVLARLDLPGYAENP